MTAARSKHSTARLPARTGRAASMRDPLGLERTATFSRFDRPDGDVVRRACSGVTFHGETLVLPCCSGRRFGAVSGASLSAEAEGPGRSRRLTASSVGLPDAAFRRVCSTVPSWTPVEVTAGATPVFEGQLHFVENAPAPQVPSMQFARQTPMHRERSILDSCACVQRTNTNTSPGASRPRLLRITGSRGCQVNRRFQHRIPAPRRGLTMKTPVGSPGRLVRRHARGSCAFFSLPGSPGRLPGATVERRADVRPCIGIGVGCFRAGRYRRATGQHHLTILYRYSSTFLCIYL